MTAKRSHPIECCQRCGDCIGLIGRLFQWIGVPLHRCPAEVRAEPARMAAMEARLDVVEREIDRHSEFAYADGDEDLRDRAYAYEARAKARLLAAQAEAAELRNAERRRTPPVDGWIASVQCDVDPALGAHRLILRDQKGQRFILADSRANLHRIGQLILDNTQPDAERA